MSTMKPLQTDEMTEDQLENQFEKHLKEFFTAFEASTDHVLWKNLVVEEAVELLDAGDYQSTLKELVDFLYVITGAYLAADAANTPDDDIMSAMSNTDVILLSHAQHKMRHLMSIFGIERVAKAADLVHKSNMSKLGDDGKPLRREDGKILKGPNYKPPVLDALVADLVAPICNTIH